MTVQALVGSQAVLVLLATAGTAMIMDEISSPPVASSGAAESSAPGGFPGETLYQDSQSRNVYSYPIVKQYSTYTYNRNPQYGSVAPDGDDRYPASSSYQTVAPVAPKYVSSFNGFSNMAIAKPYTYYVAHPVEISGATYHVARNEANEGLPTKADDTAYADDSQNFIPVKPANRAFNTADVIGGSGKRSLLEMLAPQQSLPAPNSLSSAIPSFLEHATVQLSFSGGYTYLTFIIPGDLCAFNQQEVLESSTSLQDKLKFGTQTNGFINYQIPYTQTIPYTSNFNSFASPAGSVSATGYDSGQYHYVGSAVQNQAMYANGNTMYAAPPGQTYAITGSVNGGIGEFVGGGSSGPPGQTYAIPGSVNGGIGGLVGGGSSGPPGQTYAIPGSVNGGIGGLVGGGSSGATFLNSMDLTTAVRSLDNHAQKAEVSKPPPSPSSPAAANNVKPNEAPAFTPASRSISK